MKNANKSILASLLLSGAILSSCTSGTSEKKTVEQVTTTVTDSTATPLKGCYIAVIKKDTIQLAVTSVNGSAVEGSLIYNFAEKDKSKGTFAGQYTNDILVADYTFNAEGTTSVRQVAFKKVADGMVEGYGDTEMKDNKSVFKDQKAIKYDDNIVLKRTENCLP